MIFLYIAISAIIILVVYKLLVLNELSLEFFIFWVLIGLCLFSVSVFPGLLNFVIENFYAGKKSHFVFVFSIFVLFALAIKFSVNIRDGNKQREKLAQKQALLNFKIENTKENFVENKILVKMAAYNEGNNIRDVLGKMPGDVDVLVIDDGSSDNTVEIATQYGAYVIKHPVNLGQGSADITGFMYALENNYEFVVEMDADGQHDPKDIPLFIKELERSDLDIVTGSRILGSTHADNSALRKFFLPYYTKLLNRLTGYNLTDSLCGFKAYRMSKIKENQDVFDQVIETQYLASELYIRFAHRGFKVTEIPIHISNRKTGISRKGIFRYGLRILKIMFRVWLLEKLLLRAEKDF